MSEPEFRNGDTGEYESQSTAAKDFEENKGNSSEVEKPEKHDGPYLKKTFRLHHTYGGTFTDFDSEEDLIDFVKDATTVKTRKNPDGSTENIFSPNAHLVHGAAHPDYPNLRVENVSTVAFPEDDE